MLWKNKEGKFHRHAGKDGNYMYTMIHTNVIILYDIIYATCRGNVGREREEGGREDRQRKRERERQGGRERERDAHHWSWVYLHSPCLIVIEVQPGHWLQSAIDGLCSRPHPTCDSAHSGRPRCWYGVLDCPAVSIIITALLSTLQYFIITQVISLKPATGGGM